MKSYLSLVETPFATTQSKAEAFLKVLLKNLSIDELEKMLTDGFGIVSDLVDHGAAENHTVETSRKLAGLMLEKMHMLAIEISARRKA